MLKARLAVAGSVRGDIMGLPKTVKESKRKKHGSWQAKSPKRCIFELTITKVK